MCTLSWVRHSGGYTLLFNRDERHTRSIGLAPVEQVRGGVRFVAPVDPDGGGSWVAVNEARLALAVLNQYDSPQPASHTPVSRGQMLLGLADLGSQAQVWNRVRTSGLGQYAPFTLAVFEPGFPVLLLGWDGRMLTDQIISPSGLVLTSSSVAQGEADRSRRKLFQDAAAGGAVDDAALERLHRSHLPTQGPLSICMHRADAETVSLTRITVSPSLVTLSYVAGAPCRGAPAETRTLRPATSSEFRVPSSAL
jgi:hypothetical protein